MCNKQVDEVGDRKVFEADFFIVPNGITKFDRPFESMVKKFEFWGFKCDESFPVVQVWVTSQKDANDERESDNWQDHMIPEDLAKAMDISDDGSEKRFLQYFPGYFAYATVKDLKEGDSFVHVVNDKVAIRFTAKQSEYRYRNHGNFQDCLAYLAANAGKYLN